ncbi:MAG: sodium:calcium antiporter [archaeon]
MLPALLLNIIGLIIACFFLVKSSSYILKYLIQIIHFLKLHDFTLGFILMSVSTSMPELTVGVMSALGKDPTLGVGTAIGSVIINLSLIVGMVSILARGIKIHNKILKKDLIYMMFIVTAPVILMTDHYLWRLIGINVSPGLSRIDGAILLLIFVLYLIKSMSAEKPFSAYHSHSDSKGIHKALFFFALSLFALLISAHFTVEFAESLSMSLGVSKLIIGMFVLGVGTSLPELVFSTKAALARHEELAIGDLVGSAITNTTLVLGLTAVIYPIYVNTLSFISSGLFMLMICFIFFTFAESDKELTWKEGISLIILYILFTGIQLYINSNF